MHRLFSFIRSLSLHGICWLVLSFPFTGCAPRASIQPEVVRESIARALTYIEQQQLPHGEFPVPFLKREQGQLIEGYPGFSPNVFGTGVMLYSLSVQPDFRYRPAATRALDFLEGQVQSNGTWIFYTPRSTRYAVFIPDVDDTAVCSLALAVMGRTPPDNHAVILNNARADGAIRTWIFPPDYPQRASYDNTTADEHFGIQTPDPVVNANVLAYLAYQHTDAPRIAAYLQRVAEAGTVVADAEYYLDLAAAAYAYAKALRCGATDLRAAVEDLGQQLHQQFNAQPDQTSDLHLALSINVWLAMQQPPPSLTPALGRLLQRQAPNGAWSAAIYFGSKRYPNRGWGSPSLTTAFAVEAFSHYLAHEDAP